MEKHIFRNHLNIEQTNVELLPNVLKHNFSDSEKVFPLPANQMCCLLLWEFPSFTHWTLSGVSKRELWWSVQMFYVRVKFPARSQVNVASCNIVFPVKAVCSPLVQDVNITQWHQSFCSEALQSFRESSACRRMIPGQNCSRLGSAAPGTTAEQ